MKYFSIIITIVILISLFFCGCQESGNTQGEKSKVELVHYDINTEISEWGDEYKIISGIVKNIAGRNLNSIEVIAKFYDINNNLLRSISDIVTDIPDSSTKEFNISCYSSNSFYENVDWNNIKFEFTIS